MILGSHGLEGCAAYMIEGYIYTMSIDSSIVETYVHIQILAKCPPESFIELPHCFPYIPTYEVAAEMWMGTP